MSGPRLRPVGSEFWPERAIGLTVPELIRTYEDGFCGVFGEPEEQDALYSEITAGGGSVFGGDIAQEVGFADSGVGKLSLPYIYAMVHFPGCFPGAAQERGDCVSHDQRNANMMSYACEIQWAKPDEVTAKVDVAPTIPLAGLKTGAFSSCVPYWFRRAARDGWSCEAAARVSMKEGGLVTCDDHTSTIGVDLTTYSGAKAGKYGATPPPESVAQHLRNNLVRTATTINSREERRDFIANGYCLSTCGSEGFESKRDEHGISRRTKTWYHAMAFGGFDDRDSTRSLIGDSLELVQNSWGNWNTGPRDIRDSKEYITSLVVITGKSVSELIALDIINGETGNIMIPRGSFWARSKDVAKRTCIAKAGVAGWARRDLWIPGPTEGLI